ncbi:MAG: hypothetical protein AMXMBFR55_17710 [Gemmatimonadota bacterium]
MARHDPIDDLAHARQARARLGSKGHASTMASDGHHIGHRQRVPVEDDGWGVHERNVERARAQINPKEGADRYWLRIPV